MCRAWLLYVGLCNSANNKTGGAKQEQLNKRAVVQQTKQVTPLSSSCISTCSQSPASTHYIIIRHDSKCHPLPVFEFRPRSRQREWNPSVTPHPRLARQDAQIFFRLMRCRDGSNVNPTSGFSMAIGLSHARLTLRSAVGRISTTRQSTSIPTSSRPFSSCSASGISSSTLPADTLGSLAPISLFSPSSC